MLHKPTPVPPILDADFARWAALSDEYANQLAAMARGEPVVREKVARLAEALEDMGVPLLGQEEAKSAWLTV